MDPLIVNPLERFLRLNPTAVPCTGDNTAWKVPWNKMPRNKVPGGKVPEKDSAALLLFAPGFPSSCRGLRLMPAEEKQEDEEDSLSIAVLRARQQLGKGEDCDVADLFQVVKKELEGSVDKDVAAPVAPSLLFRGMVKALEEVKDSVGWGNVEEVQEDKITLKCREEEEEDCVKLSLTLSVPSDYPLSAPGVVSCDLPGGKFQVRKLKCRFFFDQKWSFKRTKFGASITIDGASNMNNFFPVASGLYRGLCLRLVPFPRRFFTPRAVSAA